MYCVYVDRKIVEYVFNEFFCIVWCFFNVKMVFKRIEVNWGKISVLLLDIICMKDFLLIFKWKYFINLIG